MTIKPIKLKSKYVRVERAQLEKLHEEVKHMSNLFARSGRFNDNVRQFQQIMQDNGFFTGEVDGLFGDETLEAAYRIVDCVADIRDMLQK